MVVRYLFVENYFGKNDCGEKLYRKMQSARIGENQQPVDRFNSLISSYEEKGYDPSSYILVKQNLSIRNGSHRGALALYYGTPITCYVEKDSDFVTYPAKWFEENGFSTEEMETIHSKTNMLAEKYNEPLNIVLTNNAVQFAEKLRDALSPFGTAEIYEDKKGKKAVVKLTLSAPQITYTHKTKTICFKQYNDIKSAVGAVLGNLAHLCTIPQNFGQNEKIANSLYF